MRYVINQKIVTSERDPVLSSFYVREMAESDSSTRSSVTDDESVYSSSESLSSSLSDGDNFPLPSYEDEVLPYRFEPDPSPDDTSHSRILSGEESLRDSRMGNTNW